MWGLIFGGVTTAGTRAVMLVVSMSVWLISRPGGWAVLVVLALLGLRWFPAGTPMPSLP
jgi:hypothetical protein